MAAIDHMSSQFDVVAPNRAVRIGSRTYPAVRTETEEQGAQFGAFATIPHENGGLTSVRHQPDQEHKFMTVSTHGTAFHKTPEDVHERLHSLSTIKEEPGIVERNRNEMAAMRANPARDGAFPHGNPLGKNSGTYKERT